MGDNTIISSFKNMYIFSKFIYFSKTALNILLYYSMILATCKHSQNQSFFCVLEKLQKEDEFSIQKIYAKNLQLLKFDTNVSKDCPNLFQVADIFIKVFDSQM